MGSFALTVNQDTAVRLTADNGGAIDADPIPNTEIKSLKWTVGVALPAVAGGAIGTASVALAGGPFENLGTNSQTPIGVNFAPGTGLQGMVQACFSDPSPPPSAIQLRLLGPIAASTYQLTFWLP